MEYTTDMMYCSTQQQTKRNQGIAALAHLKALLNEDIQGNLYYALPFRTTQHHSQQPQPTTVGGEAQAKRLGKTATLNIPTLPPRPQLSQPLPSRPPHLAGIIVTMSVQSVPRRQREGGLWARREGRK